MRIVYSRASLKFLAKLDNKSVDRIRKGINGLLKTPQEGDIKLLSGFTDGRKRLRIGGWRVVFKICSDHRIEVLYIIDIGSRGDIYK